MLELRTVLPAHIDYYNCVSRLQRFSVYCFGLRRITLLTTAGCLLIALSGCFGSSRPSRVGSPAPDFTVNDSDRTVTLSQYKGQVVVLNFWATWCPPCIEEMPSLVQMQQQMKAKGITVIAVSIDVDQGAYEKFLKEHGVNLLTVRDPEQKASALYGTFKWPETYVIDRGGVVRRKFIGAVDWTEPDVLEFLGKL